VFCASPLPPVLELANLILPPALKKNLANSAVLNVEANMNRFFPGGVGISFYHDAIGFSRQNNLLLNYSYPIQTIPRR
jgi:hypothetical protein